MNLGAALLSLVAIAMALWEWRRISLGMAAQRWSRTEGRVLEAYFDESWNHLDADDDPVSYSAHLLYEYRVGPRSFRSSRFTYRPTRGLDQTDAYALLRGIRRGQSIPVHYDPQRPSRAVVLPGVADRQRVAVVLWLALAVGCVWLAFIG